MKISRIISWNVNGLRAALKKGFIESANSFNADIICLQETKMREGQAEIDLPGYTQYWYSANKPGYSGTAIFTKAGPLSASYGIGIEEHDNEGRVITLEFDEFFLIDCYTPNSQRELARLDYRMEWEDAMRGYLLALDQKKPVILTGDLNVAHNEIDLKHPKSNRNNAGFTDAEREKMTRLLSSGFVDTYRQLYPDKTGAYTWWSYMNNARANNSGWRIDYFIVSKRFMDSIEDSFILPDIMGSDHCPVGIYIRS